MDVSELGGTTPCLVRATQERFRDTGPAQAYSRNARMEMVKGTSGRSIAHVPNHHKLDVRDTSRLQELGGRRGTAGCKEWRWIQQPASLQETSNQPGPDKAATCWTGEHFSVQDCCKITQKKSMLEGSSPAQERMNAASCPIHKVSTDAKEHPNEAIARVSDRSKLSNHHEKVQTKCPNTPPIRVRPSPLPCHLPPGHKAILQHGPKI